MSNVTLEIIIETIKFKNSRIKASISSFYTSFRQQNNLCEYTARTTLSFKVSDIQGEK